MSISPPDEPLRPNYDATLDFLLRRFRSFPVHLARINPDKRGAPICGVFRGRGDDLREEIRDWVEEWNGRKHWNIHFTIGGLRSDMEDEKPSEQDVRAVRFFAVDLDPRNVPKGWEGSHAEWVEQERAHILASLTTDKPEGVPGPPTWVLDSGGGYWGFWALQSTYEIQDRERDIAHAKSHGKHLIELYRAHFGDASAIVDGVANLERLCRLPGTVNYPDKKKREEKGRCVALASVVEEHCSDRRYPIFAFQPPNGSAGGRPVVEVEVSGKVKRFESVDKIKELRDRPQCRVVIVQGLDPDDPDKFGGSRSEWLFFVCCEMVRAGCDDDTIYSVITDPDFKISDSVYTDSQGHPVRDWEEYALRQIQRAREEAAVDAEHSILRELNERHAVVESFGGKCRITSWERSGCGERDREMLQFQSFTDFHNRYKNRWVEVPVGDKGKTVRKPAGVWWTEHHLRRQYRGIVFDPSVDGDANGYMNLWRGFSVSATPGEYPLFRELVDEVLASGDRELSEYLWKWTAWLIQNRHEQAEVALVLRGKPGTGKGTFVRTLGDLFGQHFVHVSSSKDVAGNFNAHMRDCVLLFGDEAFLGGSQDSVGTLKRIITEPTLFIEGKGQDARQWPNRLHVILASNEDWVVPTGPDERRFVALDISTVHKEDEPWFAAIKAEMNGGGLSALLYDMLAMDLGDWHPRRGRPQTAALTDQKVHSLSGIESEWFESLQSALLHGASRLVGGEVWLSTTEHLDYLNLNLRPRKLFGSNALAALLGEPQSNHSGRGMGFEKRREQPGRGYCGYVIPPLAEARRRWDERRFPYPWDDADDWFLKEDDPKQTRIGP
jgi:Mesyanzhinovviridae DNA primase